MLHNYSDLPAANSPKSLKNLWVAVFWVFVFSGVFVAVAFFIAPQDIFSTAYWYDSLNIQQVYNAPPDFQSAGRLARNIMRAFQLEVTLSTEALIFAWFLWGAQVIAAYISGTSGNYWVKGNNTPNSYFQTIFALAKTQFVNGANTVSPKAVNWERFYGVTAYWLLAVFDTYTDVAFKISSGTPLTAGYVLTVVFVSLVVFNFGSEWGILEIPAYLLGVVHRAMTLAQRDMAGIKLPKRKKQKTQNKPKKQPPPQRNNRGNNSNNRRGNNSNRNNSGHNRGGGAVSNLPADLRRELLGGS